MEVGVKAQSAIVHSNGFVFNLRLGAHIPLITGEAYVYALGSDYAVKVYHGLNPLYVYDQALVMAAQRRLRAYPVKLAEYPITLPPNIIRPLGVVYDESGQPVGYYMRLINGCRKLSELLATSTRRKENINPNFIMRIMRNVHSLVEAAHAAGVVICDLKPSNILVRPDGEAFLIDTDSMRFGPYLSAAYTMGYVDPRQLDPQNDGETVRLRMLPSQRTDWYAYTVMLCKAFLQAMPYEGVAVNKNNNLPYTAAERYRMRLTLFSKDSVMYPPLAIPRNRIPPYVLRYLTHAFEQDGRGACPISLLNAEWKRCTVRTKGVEHGWHARTNCPECASPSMRRGMAVQELQTYNQLAALPANPASEPVLVEGRIVAATCHKGLLRLVQVGEDGTFADSNGRQFTWASNATRRCVLSGRRLAVFANNSLLIGTPAKFNRRIIGLFASKEPPLAANSQQIFYFSNNQQIVAVGANGSPKSDYLPADQVALWAGEEVGFAFVRNGYQATGITFNAQGQPFVISKTPCTQLYGQVNAVQCYFGKDRVWFFASLQHGRARLTYMLVTNNSGEVLYEQMLPATKYLASVVGHCAFSDRLALSSGVHFLEIACSAGSISRVRTHRNILPSAQPGQIVLPVTERRFFAVHGSGITPFKLPE